MAMLIKEHFHLFLSFTLKLCYLLITTLKCQSSTFLHVTILKVNPLYVIEHNFPLAYEIVTYLQQ